MKDLNITIVNWNMRDDIDKCLSSLFRDVEGCDLDIVVNVVDNSSNNDGVKELLRERYPAVNYIDSDGNVGFGRGQNSGFDLEPARFYLPLNPDIEFLSEGNTIQKVVNFLEENSHIGVAGTKLLNTDGSIQHSCCRFPDFTAPIIRRLEWDKKNRYLKKKVDNYLMKDFNHDKTVPVDWIIGSFMMVRAEVAEEVGFFDDGFFMYFEDCDWCRRAWNAGWEVYYIHDIIMKHAHRRDSADSKSAFMLVLKNPITRTHIKSWLRYFLKWRFKKERRGI